MKGAAKQVTGNKRHTPYRFLYVRSISLSRGSKDIPGCLVMVLTYMASLGWTRITSSLRQLFPSKMSPGTSRNCTRTSALRSFRAGRSREVGREGGREGVGSRE